MNQQRYIRQVSLSGFGADAQSKLAEAGVLVVGLGGLGIPVLQYLNAMGIGKLGIVEQDIVELSNLHRQPLYSEQDLGRPKLAVALEKLKAQNSGTEFKAYNTFLAKDNALSILEAYDLVIDASDNFATRYLINDACVILKKPFVSGALHGFEGQVSVFNYKGGPTYRCLFPDMPGEGETPDCNTHGVVGVLPGIIGSLQALEAVKVLTGIGTPLSGKLLIYNGLNPSTLTIGFDVVPANTLRKELEATYGTPSVLEGCGFAVSSLRKLLETGSPIQLIDVRSAGEFQADHLPEARNIPLEQIGQKLEEIDAKQPIYCLCQTGKRSKIALQHLKSVFPESRVYNVEGGLDNYRMVCL